LIIFRLCNIDETWLLLVGWSSYGCFRSTSFDARRKLVVCMFKLFFLIQWYANILHVPEKITYHETTSRACRFSSVYLSFLFFSFFRFSSVYLDRTNVMLPYTVMVPI
jgi:hypothetical protein